MKFNWGTGIFLFYTFFAGMLVFQVIQSTQYDNSLVSEDYYKEDLAYQLKYDKIQNSGNLENPVQIVYDDQREEIIFSFPFSGEEVIGQVLFYRPATKKLDMEFTLQLDEAGHMTIPTALLKEGRWRVSVDWSHGAKSYFDEQVVDLI